MIHPPPPPPPQKNNIVNLSLALGSRHDSLSLQKNKSVNEVSREVLTMIHSPRRKRKVLSEPRVRVLTMIHSPPQNIKSVN